MNFTFSVSQNLFFLKLAKQMEFHSQGKNTKVGCVIVNKNAEIKSVGANYYPPNVIQRHQKPEKYAYIEHAERNAVYFAAQNGIALKDCIAYITMPPCPDCTRSIIFSGISELVFSPMPESYAGKYTNTQHTYNLLNESGISYLEMPKPVRPVEQKAIGFDEESMKIAHRILLKTDLDEIQHLIIQNNLRTK